jgi:hypothetical protein
LGPGRERERCIVIMTPSGYKLAAISSIPASRCQSVQKKGVRYCGDIAVVAMLSTDGEEATTRFGFERGWLGVCGAECPTLVNLTVTR